MSSIGKVTGLARRISEASTTGAEMRGFTFGSLSGYKFANLLFKLDFLSGFCHSSFIKSSSSSINGKVLGSLFRLGKYLLRLRGVSFDSSQSIASFNNFAKGSIKVKSNPVNTVESSSSDASSDL